MDLDDDEYMDLLKSQSILLSRFKLNVSHEVSDFVGKSCLQRWLTNIFPITCQTCGKPQGDEAFVSADGPLADDKILLSLHHGKCRGSKTTPRHKYTMRTPTWAAAVASLGDDPDATGSMPMMVINPSCEQVLVQRTSNGQCRNATLDGFLDIGFKPATGEFPDLVDTVEARIVGDRFTVAFTTDLRGETNISVSSMTLRVPDGIRRLAARSPFLALTLTTRILPTRLGPDELSAEFSVPEGVSARVPFQHA